MAKVTGKHPLYNIYTVSHEGKRYNVNMNVVPFIVSQTYVNRMGSHTTRRVSDKNRNAVIDAVSEHLKTILKELLNA